MAQDYNQDVTPCVIDGCGKPRFSRGWCSAHYTRWRRHGDPETAVRPYGVKHTAPCEVESCGQPYRAKGLCAEHYAELHVQRTRNAGPCNVAACQRSRHMRGWCAAHYQRWLAHGSVHGGGPERRVRGTGYSDEWYHEQRRRKLGSPSAETMQYVGIIRNDPCVYCGAPTEHVDHIRAVTNGGSGDWTNLAPTCATCNHRKSTADVLQRMLRRLEVA